MLAFLACAGHGRRAQTVNKLSDSSDLEALGSLLLALNPGAAFSASAPVARSRLSQRTSSPAMATRREVLSGAATAAGLLLSGASMPALADTEGVTPDGVKYKVVKEGKAGGTKGRVGDLIVIRFKGKVIKSGNKIDDIMDKEEGYFYRIGSNKLIPGIDLTLKEMKPGDIWDLEIPSKLAFGEKGQPARVGIPRIPANADVAYTLEFYQYPGKEEVAVLDGNEDTE